MSLMLLTPIAPLLGLKLWFDGRREKEHQTNVKSYLTREQALLEFNSVMDVLTNAQDYTPEELAVSIAIPLGIVVEYLQNSDGTLDGRDYIISLDEGDVVVTKKP